MSRIRGSGPSPFGNPTGAGSRGQHSTNVYNAVQRRIQFSRERAVHTNPSDMYEWRPGHREAHTLCVCGAGMPHKRYCR